MIPMDWSSAAARGIADPVAGLAGLGADYKGSFTVDEIEHRGAPDRLTSGDAVRIFAGR